MVDHQVVNNVLFKSKPCFVEGQQRSRRTARRMTRVEYIRTGKPNILYAILVY